MTERAKKRRLQRDSIKLLKKADKKVKDMGDLIDLPMETFKLFVEKHFNAGEIKMLCDQFKVTYENLYARKDSLLKVVEKDESKREEVVDTIKRIYLVLQRLEDRIVYLSEREKDLLSQ